MTERESLLHDDCPDCGYEIPPVVSRSESGVYLGRTCQKCGWHPRFEAAVLPEACADLSNERLRLRRG